MIELSEAFQIAGLTALVHMLGYYIWSLIKTDASVVDIGWGLGFVLIAWVLATIVDDPTIGFYFIVTMVSIWGIRLGYHIHKRHLGKPEDFRYQNWRNEWGSTFLWRSFLQVFMLQGFFMVLIASPVIFSAANAQQFEFDAFLGAGTALWLIGFYFEAVGDAQLNKFIRKKAKRKNPKKGKQIMDTGLWKFTRHPNYFGEVTMWWGLYIAVLGINSAWWVIISPLIITYLLLKVSGITMLEKKYEGNKEFEKYKKNTNAFFPGFPNKR